MKKTLLLLLLLACLALCACEKDKPLPSCQSVSDALCASQSTAELTALDEKQIEKYVLLSASQYADAAVSIDATRVTAECVLVFTAQNQDGVAALESALTAYRDDLLAQYRDYRPQEVPKLESAQVRVNGLQVALAVLPDTDAAQQALDECWK